MNTLVLVIVIVSSMILVGINVWLLWFTKMIYDVSVRIFVVSERLLEETIILKDETIVIRKDTRVVRNESTTVRELTETLSEAAQIEAAARHNKSLTGNDRVVIE